MAFFIKRLPLPGLVAASRLVERPRGILSEGCASTESASARRRE
jgi:hypothetical protein